MKENKLFAQRIGLIGIANIIVTLFGFILLPIVTKSLNITEYGVWVEISVFVTLIPGIVSLGLPNAMVRFLAVEKRLEKIQESFYSIGFVILSLSIIISLIFLLLSNVISNTIFAGYINTTRLLSLVIFISCINYFVINYFRTFQQVKRYSFFLLLQSFLTLIFVAIFAILGFRLFYFVIGLLSANIITFTIMIIMIISEIGFKIPKFSYLKEYLSFGIPSIIINLSSWTISSSDNFLIAIFLGAAFTGYYAPGYALGSLLFIIINPFTVHLTPVLSEVYDQNRIDKVKNYLRYSQKYFLLISIPAFFGLSVLSKPLLMILTTPEIALNGYLVTPFVALGILIACICDNYRQILVLEKKMKIIGFIGVFAAVINVLLNILLIPYIGILGAAITTLIGYLIMFLITLQYSSKYIKFDSDLVFILKSILASILMTMFIITISPNGIINIITTVLVSAIIYFIILLLLKGITKKEFLFIKGFLK